MLDYFLAVMYFFFFVIMTMTGIVDTTTVRHYFLFSQMLSEHYHTSIVSFFLLHFSVRLVHNICICLRQEKHSRTIVATKFRSIYEGIRENAAQRNNGSLYKEINIFDKIQIVWNNKTKHNLFEK